MDFNQALIKAQAESNGKECIEALDMGSFWAFAFGEKDELCGGGYVTVDKTTGDVSTFLPTENLALFRKAKPIKVQ